MDDDRALVFAFAGDCPDANVVIVFFCGGEFRISDIFWRLIGADIGESGILGVGLNVVKQSQIQPILFIRKSTISFAKKTKMS